MNFLPGFLRRVSRPAGFPAKKVLVLEGGGMRGIFLVGILQAFADRRYFPWKLVIGSSAGALTAATYLTRQIHLARDAFFTSLLSRKFIQYANIFNQDRHILDLDWLVDTIISSGREKLDLTALKKAAPLLITATRVEEDIPPRPVYFHSRRDDALTALKATAALPYLYRGFVHYRGRRYLDGGLLAPVPYQKALELGYREKDILVLLTRPRGYRKKKMSIWIRTLYEQYYKEPHHALLRETLMNRFTRYNRILDDLENSRPEIEIIYPPEDFEVRRLSRDEKKILAGFEQGITAAANFLYREPPG